MKQLEKDNLCYYCLGCEAEATKDFRPVIRCKNFEPGIETWQEKLREELRKNGN